MEWQTIVGILFAIVSGLVNNLGNVIQKKAINKHLELQIDLSDANLTALEGEEEDVEVKASNTTKKFSMKKVMTSKLWLFGFLMQLVVATALFILAQKYIGPTLTPALGSIGIIVLAFGGLTQEKLSWDEYLGLLMIIASVILLTYSGMTINSAKTDFLEVGLVIRVSIYTGLILAGCLFCKLWSRRKDKWEGIMCATVSGLFIALSNFWISPLVALAGHVVTGRFNDHPTFDNNPLAPAIIFWLVAVGLAIWSNVQAIYERQLAFKVGKATTIIPITHIPSHLSPPVIYSFCFGLSTPKSYSMPMMLVAVVLLLVSTFIFAKREAGTESKKVTASDDAAEDHEAVELVDRSILIEPSSPKLSPFLTRRGSASPFSKSSEKIRRSTRSASKDDLEPLTHSQLD